MSKATSGDEVDSIETENISDEELKTAKFDREVYDSLKSEDMKYSVDYLSANDAYVLRIRHDQEAFSGVYSNVSGYDATGHVQVNSFYTGIFYEESD